MSTSHSILSTALLTAVFSPLLHGQQLPCPTGFKYHGKKCYKYQAQDNNWQDAQTDCEGLGGFLAEPRSAAEDAALTEIRKKKAFLPNNVVLSSWIGLTDKAFESEWRWSTDDSLVGFTNWETSMGWTVSQPNGGPAENCVVLALFGWNDADCSKLRHYICQSDSRSTTTTAPTTTVAVTTNATETSSETTTSESESSDVIITVVSVVSGLLLLCCLAGTAYAIKRKCKNYRGGDNTDTTTAQSQPTTSSEATTHSGEGSSSNEGKASDEGRSSSSDGSKSGSDPSGSDSSNDSSTSSWTRNIRGMVASMRNKLQENESS